MHFAIPEETSEEGTAQAQACQALEHHGAELELFICPAESLARLREASRVAERARLAGPRPRGSGRRSESVGS